MLSLFTYCSFLTLSFEIVLPPWSRMNFQAKIDKELCLHAGWSVELCCTKAQWCTEESGTDNAIGIM